MLNMCLPCLDIISWPFSSIKEDENRFKVENSVSDKNNVSDMKVVHYDQTLKSSLFLIITNNNSYNLLIFFFLFCSHRA